EREALFIVASRQFAAMRQQPAVLHPPIALDDARFERVLYLHMAALAAVEGTRREAVPMMGSVQPEQMTFNAGSLMDERLNHEDRFWVRREHSRTDGRIDVPLARQLVAAATIRGGLTKGEVRELCVRLEDRRRTRDDDALRERFVNPAQRAPSPGRRDRW